MFTKMSTCRQLLPLRMSEKPTLRYVSGGEGDGNEVLKARAVKEKGKNHINKTVH